jgi:hypothetical protein
MLAFDLRFVPQDIFDGHKPDEVTFVRDQYHPGSIDYQIDFTAKETHDTHPIRLKSCMTISSGIFGETVNGVCTSQ